MIFSEREDTPINCQIGRKFCFQFVNSDHHRKISDRPFRLRFGSNKIPMYHNPQFEAAARTRRTKAFLLTVFLFVAALAAFSYADSGSFVPAFIYQFFEGAEAADAMAGV